MNHNNDSEGKKISCISIRNEFGPSICRQNTEWTWVLGKEMDEVVSFCHLSWHFCIGSPQFQFFTLLSKWSWLVEKNASRHRNGLKKRNESSGTKSFGIINKNQLLLDSYEFDCRSFIDIRKNSWVLETAHLFVKCKIEAIEI